MLIFIAFSFGGGIYLLLFLFVFPDLKHFILIFSSSVNSLTFFVLSFILEI